MHVCTVDRSVPQEYNGRLPGAIGWKVMEWGYICLVESRNGKDFVRIRAVEILSFVAERVQKAVNH